MSAHTPGPWQVFGVRRRLGTEDCQQVGPDSCAIAFLPIGRDLPGALADARLIAAAPDLLRALREAENALADYIPTIEKNTGASLNYGHSVLTMVRAAIRATEPKS